MILYETMALSRSGHHSMKNWIIRNLVGFQIEWKFKMINASGTGFFHLGEANHDIPLSFNLLNSHKNEIEVLFVNYEDTFYDYTLFNEDRKYRGPFSLEMRKEYDFNHKGRIIFLRDFYNNLTSRIKSNQREIFTKWDSGEPHLFKVDQVFIDRWKNHARACVENKVSYLKFEDWLFKPETREKFLFENFGVRDFYGIEGIQGSQSSFEKNDESYTERYKGVEIPEETKELIMQDSELRYLIESLGYDYKNL